MTNHFGHVYDVLTYDVPLELWTDIIHHYSENAKSILDMGTGTGNVLTMLNIDEKYGFDISPDMIAAAKEKARSSESSIHLSVQDMKTFSYDHQFDMIIATSDVLNYLSNLNTIQEVLMRVHAHLNTGGIFIFDLHSVHTFLHVFNDKTYADDTDTVSYIWFCYSGEVPLSVLHELIFFEKGEDGCYTRNVERMYQRTYPHSEVIDMIKNTPFQLVNSFSDFDVNNDVVEECERVFYVLKK